jgi:hypothetical protein
MAGNTTIIPLRPTLARKRRMMINDVLPGIILLINGIAELMEPVDQWRYAILNVAVGVAVLIVFRMELKHESSTKWKSVLWFDVFAGIVLIVEAINDHHPGKIFQPALFYFLIGLVVVIRGIFHTQFPTLRKLTCDDSGFILRPNLFRRYKFLWNKVAALEIVSYTLQIKTTDGRTSNINLRRVENRTEILETMKKHLHA